MGDMTDSMGVAPIKSNGKLYSENKNKAQLLINQFQSLFTQKNTSHIPQCTDKRPPVIPNLEISTDGVEKTPEESKGG